MSASPLSRISLPESGSPLSPHFATDNGRGKFTFFADAAKTLERNMSGILSRGVDWRSKVPVDVLKDVDPNDIKRQHVRRVLRLCRLTNCPTAVPAAAALLVL